ncbi:MAG: hypothetical protein JWO75_158 [Actinomycetia bacterium]|jgi:hypothetical protein|nr:hypothetical protein [Actinomycetes bacterium]
MGWLLPWSILVVGGYYTGLVMPGQSVEDLTALLTSAGER